MGGGGKGGSQTTSVRIPAWLEDAAQRNLSRADSLSQIGYTPQYGPSVAAMTPAQIAAMQGTNSAASAFGLQTTDPMAGMLQAQNFAGGVHGYSTMPLYNEMISQLQQNAPGQYAALTAPFINPVTGAAPVSPYGQAVQNGPAQMTPVARGGEGDRQGVFSGGPGGFTGFGDMINGGGSGASGATFQGGPLSGALNTVGVRPAGGGSGMGGGK